MNWFNRKWIKLNWRKGNRLFMSLLIIASASFPVSAQVPISTLLTGAVLARPNIVLSSLPATTSVPASAFLIGSALGIPDIRFGLPSNNTLVPTHANQSPSINTLVPNYANQWILVPLWLGGTWKAASELVLSKYDYRQGFNTIDEPVKINVSRTSIIGVQRDNCGQIWHYIGTPFTRTIETDSFTEIQTIEKLSLSSSSQSEVIVSSEASVTRIDKAENCMSVFRENTTTTYAPLKDGLIQVTFVTNDFDIQNGPMFSSTETCVEKRIKAFQEVNRDERGDLRRKFSDFLLKNGMSDLIDHSLYY